MRQLKRDEGRLQEKGEWEQRRVRRKGGGSSESGKRKHGGKGRFYTF
jgi:hypothetical protein